MDVSASIENINDTRRALADSLALLGQRKVLPAANETVFDLLKIFNLCFYSFLKPCQLEASLAGVYMHGQHALASVGKFLGCMEAGEVVSVLSGCQLGFPYNFVFFFSFFRARRQVNAALHVLSVTACDSILMRAYPLQAIFVQ